MGERVVDKNQAMLDFLVTCPTVSSNPLFFNFAKAKENNNQFMTLSNNLSVHEPYVDGSVLKQYNFILLAYKSISFNPIIKVTNTSQELSPSLISTDMEQYPDENLVEVAQLQDIIDWIKLQAEAYNFPDFGENCIIDKMEVLSDNPVLYDVDESVSPPLVRYSITIRLEYLDNTHKLWHN